MVVSPVPPLDMLSAASVDNAPPETYETPSDRPVKFTVPFAERLVNAPVDGVVAPIAVELIPVAVVLKFEDVKVKELVPASIVELLSPLRFNVPDVPVRFAAPVVKVNPLEAVNVLFDVIVPLPVVLIFPVVERVPFSLIVNVGVPPD